MKKIFAILAVLVLVAAAFVAFKMFQPIPDDLDLATTRATDNGHFMVTVSPEDAAYQRNTIHTWIVEITTPDGAPVEGGEILIDGGMPQHGHGLPTNPLMTESLGEGRYKIEGVRFNMRGWWELKLAIVAGETSDSITFNLVMK
ncbi:MAG TPA: Auxin-binding protein [Rhodobacteraceae bacterium]|nr:Auxin-binding protein [Paracoccaceae bacterium]